MPSPLRQLKDKLLSLRTKRAVTKQPPRKTVPYSQAISVGLLVSRLPEQQAQLANALIEQLTADGKSVRVLTFLPDDTDDYHLPFFSEYFTYENISSTGEVTSRKAKQFMNSEFDYLICIMAELHPALNYIIAKSKAKIRIGDTLENEAVLPHFFELNITSSVNDVHTPATAHILNYIKALNQ